MAKHSPEHDRNRSQSGSGGHTGQQSGGQQDKHRQQQQQGPDRDRSSGGQSGDTDRKRSSGDDISDRGQQKPREDVERG